MDTRFSILELELDPGSGVPLNIALVQGPLGAVLIDTAKDYHFPAIVAFLEKQGVGKGDLRLILNTHYHGDHVGCNQALIDAYGCLVAATTTDAPAIESSAVSTRWSSPPPATDKKVPAVPDRRISPVHIRFGEPFAVSMGGESLIETIALPGHSAGSCGFYERSTASLALGDAVLMSDTLGYTSFHILQNGPHYRASLLKLRRFAEENPLQRVVTAHHPPMDKAAFLDLLERSIAFSDRVAANVQELEKGRSSDEVAHELCRRMGKTYSQAAQMVALAYMTP